MKKLITPYAASFGRPNVTIKHFADGESYVRVVPKIKGKTIIYHRLYPEPEKRFFELLLILSKTKASDVFIPYLPYARQDKENKQGEAVSADVLCRLLKNANVKKLITYDCHFLPRAGKFKRAGLEIENRSAGGELYQYAKRYFKHKAFVVVSPDEGASYFTEYAQGHSFRLKKKRKKHNEVKYIKGEVNVRGKNVCILDDIIDTGDTIRRAIEHLQKNGAKRIIVGATHGIFSKGKIKKANLVFTTDSIPNSHSVIALASP
ncbi:hypothetical protein A3H56_01140 [Candidatus Nomurabacteria bacterium RIFCSPLOWO2_02_FULL_42_24]|nr:MAG: hypothetical protein A3H56_01140 [Candidatus Nomurabacteria bacterium RIFCSPLOWO2_02_FULL_42_24]